MDERTTPEEISSSTEEEKELAELLSHDEPGVGAAMVALEAAEKYYFAATDSARPPVTGIVAQSNSSVAR